MESIAPTRSAEAARKAAYRARNPEKSAAAIARDHARVRADAAGYLLRRAAARAKERGIPFTITAVDVVVPATCPVLGIPLAFGGREGRDNSPTIDRTIPTEGYVPGNVRVISYRANRIKTDATLAELQALVAYLSFHP